MNTNDLNNSDGCLGFALGIFLAFCIAAQLDCMPWNQKPREPTYNPNKGNYTSNIHSGPRTIKTLKMPREEVYYQTYEVSQWVDAGDWSHDRDELTVTIPIQRRTMDLDYVEDHWDDFISDPEDEILYPPEIFQ